ncbi:MAG TPA: zinc-ribbon domain-containing protein, partial [Euryarchaeota archaeon]|nr:zinc-ribbon domain-containing protein [Euryarchaeota archaeon]
GNRSTLYNYSITVVNDNVTSDICPYVNIGELKGISIDDWNKSMLDHFLNEDNTSVTYYLLTHANGTINLFSFSVSVNGVWYEAGNLNDGTVFAVQGPIDESTLAVLGYLSIYMFFTVMQLAFPVFLILLLFLRFMYKSQEAKRKMLESYRKKKLEDDGKGGPDMGDPERSRRLSAFGDGSDEMFVCSECGADVPATAKFCPNCGESFEDEEPEIDIGDDRLRGRG